MLIYILIVPFVVVTKGNSDFPELSMKENKVTLVVVMKFSEPLEISSEPLGYVEHSLGSVGMFPRSVVSEVLLHLIRTSLHNGAVREVAATLHQKEM